MKPSTAPLRALPRNDFSPAELQKIWAAKTDNMRRAWAHYEARETELASMPFVLTIELTQNCNFRCKMCAQSFHDRFKKYNPDYNMSLELFVRLAEEVFPTAINVDMRGFGETTLLPWWPEVVDSLERYPFIEWNLVTNLSLTRDDVWEKMIRYNFIIGFSCDGSDKEMYEQVRVRSNFERTCHNLDLIRSLRKKHGSGFIYFISTIQKQNVHDMAGMVELAARYEVPEVQFHIIQGGHDRDLQQELKLVGPRKIADYALKAIDVGLEKNVRVTFNDPVFTHLLDPAKVAKACAPLAAERNPPAPFFEAEGAEEATKLWEKRVDASRVAFYQKCFKPFSFAHFAYDGEMGPCNHLIYPIAGMGNFKETPVKNLWNAAGYQNMRRELLEARPSDMRCQWCFKSRLTD